jgi:hypothetical protein
MPIVRRTRCDIDKAKLLAELAARPRAMRPETPPDMRPSATGLRKLACEAGAFRRPQNCRLCIAYFRLVATVNGLGGRTMEVSMCDGFSPSGLRRTHWLWTPSTLR